MDKISIVVPVYNEEDTIKTFYDEIIKVLKELKVDYELIFVDDGSKDKTIKIIKELVIKNKKVKYISKDKRIKYLSFSRNFGKESAMYAGFAKSSGDYICSMDVDMQDPPELLIEMYKTIKKGKYDCIGARRITMTHEGAFRNFLTKNFYKLINKISSTEIVRGARDFEIVRGARDFRLMKRKMIESVLDLSEKNRFSKGLLSWVGYNTKYLEYKNIERSSGKTKYNIKKLFRYAIDGIIAFSDFPLKLSLLFSILTFIISLIMFIIIIIKLFSGITISIWLGIPCLILFMTSIILFTIWVVSEYISKIYLEVKDRPLYIIRETNVEDL